MSVTLYSGGKSIAMVIFGFDLPILRPRGAVLRLPLGLFFSDVLDWLGPCYLNEDNNRSEAKRTSGLGEMAAAGCAMRRLFLLFFFCVVSTIKNYSCSLARPGGHGLYARIILL